MQKKTEKGESFQRFQSLVQYVSGTDPAKDPPTSG